MKRLLRIILIVFVMFSSKIIAQEAETCVNRVSTNPLNNPTLEHLNALPPDSLGINPDLRFLNTWKWWFDKDPNANNTIPLNNMGLNSGEWYGSGMEHFNEDVSQGFYSYLSFDNQEVMLPENGWELVADNRGWYPDNNFEVDMNHQTLSWNVATSLRALPYMLFYNKYTGMARVFVRYGDNTPPTESINAVEITILHPDEKEMSGMLRLADGYDRTLDTKSIVQRVTSVVPSPGAASKWFSADFQLAFDPCVCYHESRFELYFRFLTKAKIGLYGRALSVDVPLIDSANTNNELIDENFFGSFNQTAGGDANGGYLIYEHMKYLVDDYLQKMIEYKDELYQVTSYNAEVERKLALLEIGKVVLTAGVTAVTGMSNYTALLGKIPVLQNIDKNATFNEKTQKVFWKELDKVLSTGFKLLTKESLEKKEKPDEPTMPTASVTEMRFSGDITSSNLIQTSPINTPGSKNADTVGVNNNRPQRYPIYNEALGVFALLEKPKLAVSHTKETTKKQLYREHRAGSLSYKLNEVNIENTVQFKLKDELKYTFNPALNIKSYDIQASIVSSGELKCCHPDRAILNHTSGGDMDRFMQFKTNFNNNVNIESTVFRTDTFVDLKSYIVEGLDTLTYNSIYTPIDALKSTVFSFGYNQDYKHPDNFCGEMADQVICDDYIIYDNPNENSFGNTYHLTSYDEYLSLSDLVLLLNSPYPYQYIGTRWRNLYFAFNDDMYSEYTNSIFNNLNAIEDELKNRALDYEIDKNEFYLKLLINVTYQGEQSDGSPHEYTYMFTYKIDPGDITIDTLNPIDPNLVAGSPGHINQYPQYLFLDSENFNGQPVEGCQLTGSTYLCKAIEEATLTGTFSVANGYNVIVEAGNEVQVTPEAITPPEMVWQIAPPVWDYSNPMPPVIADSVKSFCSDKGLYAASSGSKSLRQADSIASGEEEEVIVNESSIFDFTLYPNPTNGRTTARIALDENAIGDLYITDLNGRKLSSAFENERIRKGANQYNMPTEKLSSGIYLVHLFINGEHHVKRLVKQ